MSVHVIKEARRCLHCKKPACMLSGCPVQTHIPEMIRLFLEGRIVEAGRMLFDNNPMSIFCSLVCDHDAQCEGHCNLAKKGAGIQISSIEHYISSAYLQRSVLRPGEMKGQHVAVIGSGPAGLTVAIKLAQRGYDVTIFERMASLGGMMRYGIPDFRLPHSLLDQFWQKLKELGIHVRLNTTIGGALHLDKLLSDGYDAVFIGTGAWRPKLLGVKGESLGNCHYGMDYLKAPEHYELGEHVAVIGSGNSAMDVARSAIRHGGSRRVTVYARSPVCSASPREVEYAQADGVDFVMGVGVSEITARGPMIYERHFDETGKCISEGEPHLARADSVIISISQGPKDKIARTTDGLVTDERGLVVVDEHGATSLPGVFSGGDVTTGPRNIVLAMKSAKNVATYMDAYLTEQRLRTGA